MRRSLVALATAIGLVAPLAVVPTASATIGPVVPGSSFGMVVNSIGGSTGVPGGVGSIRLWDSGVTWRDIEPTGAVPTWTKLDAIVTKVRAAGVRDILFTLGATPYWARIPSPAEKGDAIGPGAASYPAKDAYWTWFVTALVKRYKGRITSYQIWNEANLPMFYRGTPQQLAMLTLRTYRLIKSIDPAATVVSPSWLLRYWNTNRDSQLLAMKAVGWPFDAASVHSYPFATEGLSARISRLNSFRARLTALGTRKPIWDTEVNFGDRRPGYGYRYYSGAAAATLVARAYIDSLRLGVSRTYWYSWDTHELGIDMTTSAGAPTAGAVAYRVIRYWIAGNHWNGCTTASNGISRCALTTSTGTKRTIIYTGGPTVRTTVPLHAVSACTLDGRCRSVRPGTALYVSGSPQFLIGA